MNLSNKIILFALSCFFTLITIITSDHPADPFSIIKTKIPLITDHEYFYTTDTTHIYVAFLAYKSDVLDITQSKMYEKIYLFLKANFKNIIFIRAYGTILKAPNSNNDPSAPNFNFSQYPVIFIVHNNAIIGTFNNAVALEHKKTMSFDDILNFIVTTVKNNP